MAKCNMQIPRSWRPLNKVKCGAKQEFEGVLLQRCAGLQTCVPDLRKHVCLEQTPSKSQIICEIENCAEKNENVCINHIEISNIHSVTCITISCGPDKKSETWVLL